MLGCLGRLAILILPPIIVYYIFRFLDHAESDFLFFGGLILAFFVGCMWLVFIVLLMTDQLD
jgi:hypothetical protein